MPHDTPVTRPVLIHVDPRDWKLFQQLCGNYKVSQRIRQMVREELKAAGVRSGR